MNKNNQPTCQISKYETKRWTLDGQYHREDGPAIEYKDGTKFWYFHAKLHRLDGPAYESPSGYKEWWYYNKYIECSSQEEFERLVKLKSLW